MFIFVRYGTFLKVFKDRWSDILKFRDRSMSLAAAMISLQLQCQFFTWVGTRSQNPFRIAGKTVYFGDLWGVVKIATTLQFLFFCLARFSQCELCWHFKNDISKAKTIEEKLGQLIEYRRHLADQYADRATCWSLQELSVDDQSDLLVIQVDGMDQSKYRLPRDPKLRATSAVLFGHTLVMFLFFFMVFPLI